MFCYATSATFTCATWGLWVGTSQASTMGGTGIGAAQLLANQQSGTWGAQLHQQWGHQQRTPTDRELAQMAAAQMAAQQHLVAMTKKRAAAEAKAEALLLTYLDEDQKARYLREGAFIVTTRSGSQFELRKGKTVLEYERTLFGMRRKGWTHCVWHLDYGIPEADRLLHLKVLLAADEDKFRSIAVRSRW